VRGYKQAVRREAEAVSVVRAASGLDIDAYFGRASQTKGVHGFIIYIYLQCVHSARRSLDAS